MLAQEIVVTLIEESLALMRDLAPTLRTGVQPAASAETERRYDDFLERLEKQRKNDHRFGDEAWNWIWRKPGSVGGHSSRSAVQLYGRLAFINNELFHFL